MIECRSRYAIITALSFALCITVMEGLAFGGVIGSPGIQSTMLWITILFCAMQILPHLFIREEEEGTSFLLKLRFNETAVFISKLICTIVLLIPVSSIAAALFIFFLGIAVTEPLMLALLVIIGSLTIACSTTFLASLAARGRFKAPLFAVIAVPALLPILVPAVNGTVIAISGNGSIINDLIVIGGYGMTTAGVSFLLFGKAWR